MRYNECAGSMETVVPKLERKITFLSYFDAAYCVIHPEMPYTTLLKLFVSCCFTLLFLGYLQ